MVIQLGVAGLKLTLAVYHVNLFEGLREKGQCNLVCVDGELLDDGVNSSYIDFLKSVVSVVLVLR